MKTMILHYQIIDKFTSKLKERYITTLFDKDNYVYGDIFKFKCERCGLEFETKSQNLGDIKCECGVNYGVSFEELDLREYIESLNIEVEYNKHFTIEDTWYELDIYLPEYNIGIEYDGVYWHSDKFKEDDYHIRKTQKFYDNHNISIIHIFSTEWIYNREYIEEIIKFRLGIDSNIDFEDSIIKLDLRHFNPFSINSYKTKEIIEPKFYYQKNNKLYSSEELKENLEYNKIYDCGSVIMEKIK